MDNLQIVLSSRPVAGPAKENFATRMASVAVPATGQILLQTLYLSLDPYMRGRMYNGPSYARPVQLGDVMVGETISRIIDSRHPDYTPGQLVRSWHGWQQYHVCDAALVRPLPTDDVPATAYLGVLGLPGLTAYGGLVRHGQPKPGETLVVSAASGAVGSIVGQIGKNLGCRVVGIAGGPDKCRYLENELGFDAGVDYKAGDFADRLNRALPGGTDIYFDNVG